ncbi:MAG: hypothetical protein NTZ56_06450 [Acidobacteria bacterium]|nr:hypothetical protein [Acidobacteriota bacterium]
MRCSFFSLASIALIAPSAWADLAPKTKAAFDRYIATVEPELDQRASASGPFLWLDQKPKLRAAAAAGEVVVERVPAPGVPSGLIQHWRGGVFMPGIKLERLLETDQDYNRHKILYRPEVIDSRLINRQGDRFHIFLRLYKKKVLTVVLDTEHDVEYRTLSPQRAYSRSISRSVREVKNAGEPGEQVLPAGVGTGFLWAMNSYWRLEERDGGVWAECDAITLARDIPLGLGAVLKPMIDGLAHEAVVKTLEAKRRSVVSAPVGR